MNERSQSFIERNKLKISGALLAVAALAAVNEASQHSEKVPAPACAIGVQSGDTEWGLANSVDPDDPRRVVSEFESINSGIDAGNLNPGDELALGKASCAAFMKHDKTHEVTILSNR